jgi:hypothetical protein
LRLLHTHTDKHTHTREAELIWGCAAAGLDTLYDIGTESYVACFAARCAEREVHGPRALSALLAGDSAGCLGGTIESLLNLELDERSNAVLFLTINNRHKRGLWL